MSEYQMICGDWSWIENCKCGGMPDVDRSHGVVKIRCCECGECSVGRDEGDVLDDWNDLNGCGGVI